MKGPFFFLLALTVPLVLSQIDARDQLVEANRLLFTVLLKHREVLGEESAAELAASLQKHPGFAQTISLMVFFVGLASMGILLGFRWMMKRLVGGNPQAPGEGSNDRPAEPQTAS